MSLLHKSSIAKIAVAAGIAAVNLVTIAVPANADPHYGRGPATGYHDQGPHFSGPAPRHLPPPPPQHHRGHGNDIAKGVAIGLGALVLGTIIANEANRNR